MTAADREPAPVARKREIGREPPHRLRRLKDLDEARLGTMQGVHAERPGQARLACTADHRQLGGGLERHRLPEPDPADQLGDGQDDGGALPAAGAPLEQLGLATLAPAAGKHTSAVIERPQQELLAVARNGQVGAWGREPDAYPAADRGRAYRGDPAVG